MKCTKYSFNLTYNQESAKTLSFKYIHFPFVFVLCVCLFVCLVFFFAIFKDHAPIPSLFFQLEETSLGIQLFLNSCLPISYRVSIWPHDEWVTGISIPGGGCHDARHLESSARCLKLRCRVLYLLQRSLGHGFSKTSMVNSLITLEVYPEFCLQLQFCYNLAIHILKRTTFV